MYIKLYRPKKMLPKNAIQFNVFDVTMIRWHGATYLFCLSPPFHALYNMKILGKINRKANIKEEII